MRWRVTSWVEDLANQKPVSAGNDRSMATSAAPPRSEGEASVVLLWAFLRRLVSIDPELERMVRKVRAPLTHSMGDMFTTFPFIWEIFASQVSASTRIP